MIVDETFLLFEKKLVLYDFLMTQAENSIKDNKNKKTRKLININFFNYLINFINFW